MKNIFPIYKYEGPALFCNRDEESVALHDAFQNQRHVLLLSIRRLGKTSLIFHWHHQLRKRKKKSIPIYIDVLETQTATDFINKLLTTVLYVFNKNKNGFLESLLTQFAKFRPVISYDTLTGNPSISIDIQKPNELTASLKQIMDLLQSQKYKVQLAIDEFQQVSKYADGDVAAALRAYFVSHDNIHFLFSGSSKTILSDLFSNPKKPLFGSVQFMPLAFLDQNEYARFIHDLFTSHDYEIDMVLVEGIVSWTRGHSFYTQMLCNRLYSLGKRKIEEASLNSVKLQVLKEQEMIYMNYKNLLSPKQWELLKAIALETRVSSVSNADFLNKYRLSESTSRQALKFLYDKEIIYDYYENETRYYTIIDLFLLRWFQLRNKY